MASGLEHEKSTKFCSLPFAIVIGILIGPLNGLISGIAFTLGGIWLSPDLDIHSKALKRWGILQIIWWPYRKLISHRSIFSHGIIIGTSIRVIYLLINIYLIQVILIALNLTPEFISLEAIIKIIQKYPDEIMAAILGLEGSVWLHLIKDRSLLKFK